MVGTRLPPPLPIIQFIVFDEPPPGAELVTRTCAVLSVAMAAASMEAVNCVELMNVVVRGVPPKDTNEVVTKFVPLIVSVKAAPPATALVGEIAVIVGTGTRLPPPPIEAVPPRIRQGTTASRLQRLRDHCLARICVS